MKPIAHYENRYLITETGQVLNLANNCFLTPTANPNGYLKVALADGKGGQHQLSMHRLVAKHFIPNPYDHPQVNHKNGNKKDNHVLNLEWVSPTENTNHALMTGLRSGYMSADDKESLLQRVLNGEQVKDLATETGRRSETLHKMLRTTAERLNLKQAWETQMKENRRNAAVKQLAKINARNPR